jgi:pimeloyl-ACP methyl ester carboxylesterase
MRTRGGRKDTVPISEALYRQAERSLWQSLGLSPTERRVDLVRNGVTVRVQEVGEGPPVLFVHGTSTCGSSWASLAAHLTDFRCLLLDRPNTGLSDPLPTAPGPAGLRGFADDLVIDVLDALELQEAPVVATSLGGAIALRSAAAHPERVARMVQFGCPVGAIRPRFLPMLPLIPIMILRPNERRARALFARIGNGSSVESGRVSQEDIDWYVALLRHTNTRRNEFLTFRRSGGPTRLALSDAALADISTPTLFLWGENDPFGGPEAARGLVNRMGNARLELVPGAGHAPWLDDLDHSSETVRHHMLGR